MKKKKWILMVAVFMMVFAGVMPVQAASAKWKKACQAYKTYLAKNESHYVPKRTKYWYTANSEKATTLSDFLILDMDKNGVPELIGIHSYGMKNQKLYVFTYKNGKVTRVKNTKGKSASVEMISSTGTGWPSVYSCTKNHLHIYLSWGSGNKQYTYVIKNGKLQCYAEYEWNWIENKTTCKVNGKRVSAKKYQSVIKNCRQKKCWVTNNKKNRAKYVK